MDTLFIMEQKRRSIVAGYLPGTDKSQYDSNVHIMRWLYLPVLMLQRIKSHILRHTEPGAASPGPCETHPVPWHVHPESVTEKISCIVCHWQVEFKWRMPGGCWQVWGPPLTDRGWVQWPVMFCTVCTVPCTVYSTRGRAEDRKSEWKWSHLAPCSVSNIKRPQ